MMWYLMNAKIGNVIKKSQISHNSGNKTRGRLITLISKTTVNLVIECISGLLKHFIANEVIEAGMFSVELDTTHDVSVKDQCAIVVKYVNSSGVQKVSLLL